MRTGIFTIPAEAYHEDPADVPSLSASIATLLCNRSPRHAWTAHPKLNPAYERTEESKFDVGSACHAILLEDKPVEEVVAVVDAAPSKSGAALSPPAAPDSQLALPLPGGVFKSERAA